MSDASATQPNVVLPNCQSAWTCGVAVQRSDLFASPGSKLNGID
jgi:hypothetical protein